MNAVAHHFYTLPQGLWLIAAGLAIRIAIGRRRFNRRGIAGLQMYSSYARYLLTTMFEWLFNLLGLLLFLAGAWIALTAYFK